MNTKIRVCNGNKCTPRGAMSIMERLEAYFSLKAGTKNDRADLDFCSCTGYCERGPNVIIDDNRIIHEASAGTIAEKIENNEVIEMTLPDMDTIIKNDFLGDL